MNNFMFLIISQVIWYKVWSLDCCKTTKTEDTFHVSCRGCGLKSFPLELPVNTSVLDLAYNHIETVFQDSLKQLKDLHTLNLEGNNLSTIEDGAFDELYNLNYLNLGKNKLNTSLSDVAFKSVSNLKILILHENYFHLERAYPDIALSYLRDLRILYIDIFEGFSFERGFLNLRNLEEIHFHKVNNNHVSVKNSSFNGLMNSKLSNLKLTFRMRTFEKASLSPFKVLKSLTVDSDLTIPIIMILHGLYGLRNKSMESIVLHNNLVNAQLTTIQEQDIVYLGSICVRRLALVRNGILRIATNTFSIWNTISCIQVLDVSKNNLELSRNFAYLALFPKLTHADLSYQFAIEHLNRRSYEIEQTFFLPKSLKFLNISHNIFHGKLTSFSIADNSLEVLDFSYPELGSLYCGEAKIVGMIHLKELYISGIDCSNPKTQLFADMPKLTKLEARNSNMGKHLQMNSTILKGLSELFYVDFTGNNLQIIEPHIFTDQTNSLETLIVAENKLRHIPDSLLIVLNMLKTLDMTHNEIAAISKAEYSVIEKIHAKEKKFKIKLFGNPLLCTCEHLEFVRWMSQTRAIIDKESIECITENGKFLNFKRFLETMDTFQINCVSQFWLKVSIGLLTILLILGTVCILVWRYNVSMRILCRQGKTGPCEYDIFVSYSHLDRDWFIEVLKPRLEENNISYCCYEKTFLPGLELVDNILHAIETSRKTLFLVTFNFVHSGWATNELEYLRSYAFREGRKDMIVVVLLEDIKRSEMPKTLRRIWDTTNVLVWPNEDNYSEECLSSKRKHFWKNFMKSVPRGNNKSEENVDESIV